MVAHKVRLNQSNKYKERKDSSNQGPLEAPTYPIWVLREPKDSCQNLEGTSEKHLNTLKTYELT